HAAASHAVPSFSHGPVPHRDLLSFPTRRSSDLHSKAVGSPVASSRRSWFGRARLTHSTSPRPPGGPTTSTRRMSSTRRGLIVGRDRKSTRLNSSHEWISYAVFCLKKKNEQSNTT